MKKIILFLLFTSSIFAQDFSKDTIMGGGTQPASIIRLKNNKLYMIQNKELQAPYIKQKDGSFVSKGVPIVTMYLDKNKHTIGSTYNYVDILFESLGGTNEIIEVNDTRSLLHFEKSKKDNREQMVVYYPLKDRFLNMHFVFFYNNEDDRSAKESGVRQMIEGGFMILENYYLKYKK